MLKLLRIPIACLILACFTLPASASASRKSDEAGSKQHHERPEPPQETGFLNRRVEIHGVSYKFVVYLPEEWRRDDHKLWPIVLALHGRGERGSEGMWQTQIGLPQEIRDHPERWPFVIVMPQCPLTSVWTDDDMLEMAIAALDMEVAEFHGDPERTYLTGLSLGGYGVWELARKFPHRWAAIAICSGGIFWSYMPERWQQSTTLPGDYAKAMGGTPVWLFHGTDDPVVVPKQSELMYEALKEEGGHVRLWLYQGIKHDCWTRAYNEPELPRWFLAHRSAPTNAVAASAPEPIPVAERIVIPFHPAAIKLTTAQLDAYSGEYLDKNGQVNLTLYRQGEQLFEKNLQGEVAELSAESTTTFFYTNGSATTRLFFDRDSAGRVTTLSLRDDRHTEHWERRQAPAAR